MERQPSRRWLYPLVLVPLLFASSACGPSDVVVPSTHTTTTPGGVSPLAATAAARIDPVRMSGRYEVAGVTVQADSGRQREISGDLDLAITGDRYTVSFDLETTAPHASKPQLVRVRGTGRGYIVGGVFAGTTEERMDIPDEESPLEELDFVSTSQASFDPEGLFRIQLQNYPGVGQVYSPSVTILAGRRVGAAN